MTFLRTALAFLFALALSSCAERGAGTLEVKLTDHREAIGDFSRVEIRLEKIRLGRSAGLGLWERGWIELEPDRRNVDLTRWTAEAVTVLRREVPAASFDAIELVVGEIRGLVKSGKETAVKNALSPLQLAFSVARGDHTTIVLDLTVVDMSDHPPRGYELALAGYALYRDGRLLDRVPPQ